MIRSLAYAASVAAVGLMLLQATPTLAQTPAPAAAPQTMWNWLGIPKQPLAGVVNRGGNFSECEKKPPLKAIADPANLASKNPAIKKAAEIKAEEDLAAQKIKAIKYLAAVGCGGCYEGVNEALLAALDDCTEAVRYEAVKAILATSSCGQDKCAKKAERAAKTCHEATHDALVKGIKKACASMHLLCGKPGPDGVTLKSKRPGYGGRCGPSSCPQGRCACGDGNCCTSDILNKLSTLAYERDDRGCYKEPSPRVRAMAMQALRACKRNVRPYSEAMVDAPTPEEVPAGKPDETKETAPETKKETAPEQKETSPAASTDNAEPAAAEVASKPQPPLSAVAASDDVDAATPASASTNLAAPVVADALSVVVEPAVTATQTAIGTPSQTSSVASSTTTPIAPSPEDLFPQQSTATQPRHIHHGKGRQMRPRLGHGGQVTPTAATVPGGQSTSKTAGVTGRKGSVR